MTYLDLYNCPFDAYLFFLLQKRSRLGFDESDEEEMQDILAAALGYLVAAGGQFSVVEGAQVRPSELMDSGARGDSSATKATEESVDALFGQVGREVKMPEEHPYYRCTLRRGGRDGGISNFG